MKCNWEWLSAYLDGALSDDKRTKLEEHLKTCEACAAKLEEFARVEQAAKKIPAPQLSEAYWENFASRVQNKLTIRGKQKTSPAWLEALKSFFQPTTGKLAIAGSLATILLVAIMGKDYWKFEFEAVAPAVENKIESAQKPSKDELAFRTAKKDNKAGFVEDKRLDQPARERGTATLSQKPAQNAPAASAPFGRALVAPEEQKPKEESSLAAFGERDEGAEKDSGSVIAGKKTEETERLPLQNELKLQRRTLTLSPSKGRVQSGKADDTAAPSFGVEANAPGASKEAAANDVVVTKENIQEFMRIKGSLDAQYGGKTMPATDTAKADSDIQEWSLIMGAGDTKSGGKAKPSIDTAQEIIAIRQVIEHNEKELKGDLSKDKTEAFYVSLAQNYLQLYRLTHNTDDWKKANQRLTAFLKTDLSDPTRWWLSQIRDELKKLKK